MERNSSEHAREPTIEASDSSAFEAYKHETFALNIPSSSSRISPLYKLTLSVVETFKTCNPTFQVVKKLPQRMLTKPSEPHQNEGNDNKDGNLICRVNDSIISGESTYIILDLLGTGTFGQVFRCRKEGTKEIVAVKVIKNKPAYHAQGLLEIKIANLLNHTFDLNDEKHIVRLLENFEHKNHICLVFELLNMSLLDILTQNQFRGLPLTVVQLFTRQILTAIATLQEAGIIHCDLKPENILLVTPKSNTPSSSPNSKPVPESLSPTRASQSKSKVSTSGTGSDMNPESPSRKEAQSKEKGKDDLAPDPAIAFESRFSAYTDVKVIDYGSACFEGRTMYSYIQSRFYRSPEVLLGVPYNGSIDMWSLGCVCAELYLGLPLFPGISQHNQLSRIIEMFGMPPEYLVAHGKNGPKYFMLDGHGGGTAQNRHKYRIKTPEEYAAEMKTEVPVLKKYLRYNRLEDVVMKCPLANKHKLTVAQKEEEVLRRQCFLHFLQGLFNQDPLTRWSAKQALAHPFIRNEFLDRETEFIPPVDPRVSERKAAYVVYCQDHRKTIPISALEPKVTSEKESTEDAEPISRNTISTIQSTVSGIATKDVMSASHLSEGDNGQPKSQFDSLQIKIPDNAENRVIVPELPAAVSLPPPVLQSIAVTSNSVLGTASLDSMHPPLPAPDHKGYPPLSPSNKYAPRKPTRRNSDNQVSPGGYGNSRSSRSSSFSNKYYPQIPEDGPAPDVPLQAPQPPLVSGMHLGPDGLQAATDMQTNAHSWRANSGIGRSQSFSHSGLYINATQPPMYPHQQFAQPLYQQPLNHHYHDSANAPYLYGTYEYGPGYSSSGGSHILGSSLPGNFEYGRTDFGLVLSRPPPDEGRRLSSHQPGYPSYPSTPSSGGVQHSQYWSQYSPKTSSGSSFESSSAGGYDHSATSFAGTSPGYFGAPYPASYQSQHGRQKQHGGPYPQPGPGGVYNSSGLSTYGYGQSGSSFSTAGAVASVDAAHPSPGNKKLPRYSGTYVPQDFNVVVQNETAEIGAAVEDLQHGTRSISLDAYSPRNRPPPLQSTGNSLLPSGIVPKMSSLASISTTLYNAFTTAASAASTATSLTTIGNASKSVQKASLGPSSRSADRDIANISVSEAADYPILTSTASDNVASDSVDPLAKDAIVDSLLSTAGTRNAVSSFADSITADSSPTSGRKSFTSGDTVPFFGNDDSV